MSISAAFVILAVIAQPEAVVIQREEIALSVGQAETFKFRAPRPPEGLEALLCIQARNDSTRLAGGCPSLKLTLNGQLLDGSRLVNRGPTFQFADGRIITTYAAAGFFLYYSPDYEVANKPGSGYQAMDGQAYDFRLIVSDLLRDGENELEVRNGQTRGKVVVKARHIRIEYAKVKPRPGAAFGPPPKGPLPFYAPGRHPRVDYSVQVCRGGGLIVAFADSQWQINSFFSFPRAGWNRLAASDRPMGEERGWVVSPPQQTGRRWVVRAEGPSYRIERRVQPGPEVIYVSDTIENKTDEDMAVLIRHVTPASPEDVDKLVIGGLEVPVKQGGRWTQQNPTTLVVRGKAALALMAVDDVTRAHCYNFAENGEAGIRDYSFALPARGRRETKWWIVPVPGGDYFSMVNAIRRAQQTNFTLNGSFAFLTTYKQFTQMTDEQLGHWMDKLCLHYVCLTIATPKLKNGAYPHGTGVKLVDHSGWREMMQRVKRLRPSVKRLFYYHTFIDANPDARTLFAECRCLRPNGKQFDYNDARYPLFIPLLDNAYGRAMQENARMILSDEIGADGLYWDEMARSAADFCWHAKWDGCSADVDMKTYTIARKKSSLTLLTMEFRQRVVDDLLAAGRPIVANGNPTTETFTRRYKFPRFVETGSVSNLAKAHLYTPIGLADHHTERTQQDTIDAQRRHLMWGCLYYYYHQQSTLNVTDPGLSRYMWPITPLRLGRGFIIGRERILTAVSGNFGWGEKADAQVHVLDRQGKEVDWPVRKFEQGGASWWEVRIPGGYMVAIVRR